MPINPTLPEWKAEPLWDELWKWFGEDFPDNNLSLPAVEWVPMFCQAILAHDAGAREVSAMACRATIESLGFIFRSHRPDGGLGWIRERPANADGSLEYWTFGKVKIMLENLMVLTPELRSALDHIQFDGDAAAHISQRMEEEFNAVVQKLPRRAGAPVNPEQIWMNEKDLRRDLTETLIVIKAIMRAAKAERDRARAARPT